MKIFTAVKIISIRSCAECSLFFTQFQMFLFLGPKTWSCAKCLYPYGDPHELMTHIPTCPKLQSSSEAKSNETTPNNQANIFYKCNNCVLTFSSEEEIKVTSKE